MNKNTLAIHDICSYSKSSLTVVIPIMEALGVEVCPLPSAILSTQTDGFEDFYMKDLSDSMKSIFDKFKRENLQFDCIYTGFLSNEDQVQIVSEIIDYYKENNNSLIVVDPVLGDNKQMYSTFDSNYLNAMKKLVASADIITPNSTEACLLLDRSPKDKYSLKEINDMLDGLSELGPRVSVITSLSIEGDDKYYTAYCENNRKNLCANENLNLNYPGCGDLFTSALIAKILNKESIDNAIKYADTLCHQTLITTKLNKSAVRNGISTVDAIKYINFSS
jgi:pyridoxine kinase